MRSCHENRSGLLQTGSVPVYQERAVRLYRRVCICYTAVEIGSSLDCGRDKAMKLLAELDTGKGAGLAARIEQGQTDPPGYMSSVLPRRSCRSSLRRSWSLLASSLPTCRRRIFRLQEVEIFDAQRPRKPTLIKLKEIESIVSGLIHLSPCPQRAANGDRCEAGAEANANIE